MHSSAGSDHSSRSSETKLFGIEFSDLHVSKEDSVKGGLGHVNGSRNPVDVNTLIAMSPKHVYGTIQRFVRIEGLRTPR
jgi:hypothetical protein